MTMIFATINILLFHRLNVRGSESIFYDGKKQELGCAFIGENYGRLDSGEVRPS